MNLYFTVQKFEVEALHHHSHLSIFNISDANLKEVLKRILETKGVEFVLDQIDSETIDSYWNKCKNEQIKNNLQDYEKPLFIGHCR